MRTNAAYRLLSQWTGIAHATLARMAARAALLVSGLPLVATDAHAVDTTIIRLGRSSSIRDYTGYKHLKGIKMQVIVDKIGRVTSVAGPYPASWHDKQIFLNASKDKAQNSPLLGDKAYLGLTDQGVVKPEKRNHVKYKCNPSASKAANRQHAKQRIIIEHTFALIKRSRIFYTGFYFDRHQIALFFRAACTLHNIEQEIRYGFTLAEL